MIVICVVLLDLIRSRVMCVCVHLLMSRLCFNRDEDMNDWCAVFRFLSRFSSPESQDQGKQALATRRATHGLVAPTFVYSIEEEVVGTRFPADEDRCTRF